MNSLVFNTTADELRTSIYGNNRDTGSLQLLQLNGSGELLVSGALNITNELLTVSGSVTLNNELLTVSGSVTLNNELLTVSGSVTLNNTLLTVTGDVTLNNALLTVTGDVTLNNALLTVTGDVTLNNALLTVTGDVTLNNALLTVFVEGNQFTALTQTFGGVTLAGIALPETDISQLRTATMFVNNTGANAVTLTLQLSPDGTTYFDDPNYTNVGVAGTSSTIMVLGIFAQYAQIEYDPDTSATFAVYYNGQA